MIEITDCKRIDKGSLLAQVAIHIPQWKMTIKEIKIFSKDGKRWISLPAREFEANGKKAFAPLIKFDTSEINDKFRDSVIRMYDEYCKRN